MTQPTLLHIGNIILVHTAFMFRFFYVVSVSTDEATLSNGWTLPRKVGKEVLQHKDYALIGYELGLQATGLVKCQYLPDTEVHEDWLVQRDKMCNRQAA